jgi:hypothetical protein
VGIRANWFVEQLLDDATSDPFDVEQDGKPIDLTGEPHLSSRLIDLTEQERQIYLLGVECPIKDMPDTSCLACPVGCRDEAIRESGLCRIGQEQERVTTRLALLKTFGDH